MISKKFKDVFIEDIIEKEDHTENPVKSHFEYELLGDYVYLHSDLFEDVSIITKKSNIKGLVISCNCILTFYDDVGINKAYYLYVDVESLPMIKQLFNSL